jgi:hypothetical protein
MSPLARFSALLGPAGLPLACLLRLVYDSKGAIRQKSA